MRTAAYATEENLDQQVARWLAEVRASVAPRPHLVIDPSRCALLVVDMLRYFAHPDGRCFLPASTGVVPRIRTLLETWRSFGGTVAFTRHCHSGDGDLGMLEDFFSDYIKRGETDAEILGELAPTNDEPVFEKTTYDAFTGTDLAKYLEERGAKQVLITGVLTHMCCETTARCAFCRGYRVHVVADGTASSCEERHVQSLKSMADSVALINSTAEVLARCDG